MLSMYTISCFCIKSMLFIAQLYLRLIDCNRADMVIGCWYRPNSEWKSAEFYAEFGCCTIIYAHSP